MNEYSIVIFSILGWTVMVCEVSSDSKIPSETTNDIGIFPELKGVICAVIPSSIGWINPSACQPNIRGSLSGSALTEASTRTESPHVISIWLIVN